MALFTIASDWNQLSVSSLTWSSTSVSVPVVMALYSVKRNMLIQAATRMDLEDVLSKKIQTLKDTYTV